MCRYLQFDPCESSRWIDGHTKLELRNVDVANMVDTVVHVNNCDIRGQAYEVEENE